MYLLVESAKLMVTEIDFLDSIMILGYEEELNKELLAVSRCFNVLLLMSCSYIKSIAVKYELFCRRCH